MQDLKDADTGTREPALFIEASGIGDPAFPRPLGFSSRTRWRAAAMNRACNLRISWPENRFTLFGPTRLTLTRS